MKTNVSETSLEAYHSMSVKYDLQPKERLILDVFKGRADTTYTRQQLVDAVGLPLHSICGRANSLLAKKVLCVRGSRIDPVTKKRQELIGLPVDVQGALF